MYNDWDIQCGNCDASDDRGILSCISQLPQLQLECYQALDVVKKGRRYVVFLSKKTNCLFISINLIST